MKKTRRTWRNGKKAANPRRRLPVHRLVSAAAGALRGRVGWVAGGVVVLVLGLLGARLFLDGHDDGPPDPRARQYKDFDACLLTGEKGIAQGTLAASVWEGMQKASLETLARVTYVPVVGPQSVGSVQPFFNGLIQRQCDVVVAVGASQVQVTQAGAEKHPAVRFVVVDGTSGTEAEKAEAGNVTVVKPGGRLKETVADAIRQAVRASDA